ncbi:MAG TPA: hypothetical protein VN765_06840 [Candidatus Acidoferrum sp.]|nr:hypothetical protein [Candidatus Acidoferrum sp.]
MNDKTATKDKGKASHQEVAAFGKKPGRLKTFPSDKSGKGHDLNPKAAVVLAKPKLTYVSHTPPPVQIHDAGLGVQFADVPASGLEMTPQEHETELAEKLVAEVADNGADVNALCDTYQLKREELARLTGFSLRALAEWAAGKFPSQPARRRLQEVRRLLDALAQIVKPESIPKWLHQRNPAFDHLTPLQLIELGEIDRLWAMVHEMSSGQPE